MNSKYTAHANIVRQQFDSAADKYLNCPVQSNDYTIKRAIELARPQKTWHVLDVASGAGHMARAVGEKVDTVLAIDLSQEMLTTARTRSESLGIKNISFKSACASCIPAESSTFDMVSCRLAIHHFLDVNAFIKEASRVLKNEGALVLVDSHLPDNAALNEINHIQKNHDASHVACLTRESFERILSDEGFIIEAIEEGTVELGFKSWTNLKDLGQFAVDKIKRLMTEDAHEDTAKVLNIKQDEDEDFLFNFQRIIIVARKRAK